MLAHLAATFLPLLPVQQTAETSPDLPPLTDDERRALATITKDSLVATVSFLASDELEGRDTPSRGLWIAGAYVAARFRGARLEGLGKDGSFFLETEVETTSVPASGVTLTDAQGRPLPHYGLLLADDADTVFEGLVPMYGTGLKQGDVSPYPKDAKLDGPVSLREIAPPQPEGRPSDGRQSGTRQSGTRQSGRRQSGRRRRGPSPIYMVYRQVAEAERRGATAVLLQVEKESPLLRRARLVQGRERLARSRSPFALRGRSLLPVLLVPAGSLPEGSLRLVLPAQARGKSRVRNVAGLLRGSDPVAAKEAIVFSAHLDHIGLSGGATDPINNGADDDATGVTGVIALAECFAALKERPQRSLIFVCFWGEEKGMLGSRHFVSNSPWPLDKIVANINLEMLGRPEKGARRQSWMTGWRQSNLGELMARGADRAGVRIFRHPRYSAMLYGASDNISFARQGVIAHSFSAGSLHEDYHQPGDEWQKLDLPHMTKVLRGLAAGSLPIAKGRLTPEER